MALSLEDLRRKLDAAVQERFGKPDGSDKWNYYVIETFPGYCVARGNDDKLFQIPYAVTVEEEVELGEPVEVEEVYVPVDQAASFAAEAGADELSFPVVVMKAGLSQRSVKVGEKRLPMYFGQEFVAEVAAALDNTRFGRRHPVEGENEAAQAELVAGWFDGGHLVGDEARGTLHLLESEQDLITKLNAARKAKKLDLFALSVLVYTGFKPAVREGREVMAATKLGRLARVDWCAEGAAGGRFLQVAASADARAELADLQKSSVKHPPATSGGNHGTARSAGRNKGVANMKEQILKLLAALRKHDDGRATELTNEFNSLAEDKHGEFLVKVSQASTEVMERVMTAAQSAGAGEAATALNSATEILDQVKKIQSANLVQVKLAASKLPVPAQNEVRRHLADRVVTGTEVDAEIEATRKAFAAFNGGGRVNGGTATVGLETQEKIQLAMDGMMGVKVAAEHRSLAFRSIKQAYVEVTGDRELRFGLNGEGGFLRVSQAIATGDFPNLLLNSMTKKLIQDYAEVGMGGLERLYTVVPLSDFKTQDRVRMGYLGDLPTVAEAGPYTEATKPTDEKISYAPAKRGVVITISRETILNDDLGKIKAFPERMARAARRTLKQFITDFFVNNPNFDGDGVAFFHGTHGNLGSAALSIDELTARDIALMAQTEKDSLKPLGLSLDWAMVPRSLKATVLKINRADKYNPGVGIEEPNPWYQAFGANDDRIIVNELLSDQNDWFCGADPAVAPILEIGFVGGAEEPQIFLNNDPSNGGLPFTNDQMQLKVRHEYGGDIIDYRGAQKNVVA